MKGMKVMVLVAVIVFVAWNGGCTGSGGGYDCDAVDRAGDRHNLGTTPSGKGHCDLVRSVSMVVIRSYCDIVVIIGCSWRSCC